MMPASRGLSPKAQTTLSLIAIAAVVAIVGWFMMQKPASQTVAPDKSGEGFSHRIVGRWNWGDVSCANGTNATLEGGRLVFTAPDSRLIHEIDAETAQETRTHVLEPANAAGQHYVLTPEYVATSEIRNFNLVLENKTTGERNIWSPCEVG